MKELTLDWTMCRAEEKQEAVPCGLYRLNLENLKQRAGVYIIWFEGADGGTSFAIDVGQGILKDRLGDHREEDDIKELITGLWEDTGDVTCNIRQR